MMDNRSGYMSYVDGESAYSIVSHYHFCQPVNRWRETNKSVFGTSHIRLHPSLTGHLTQIGALVGVRPTILLTRATAFPLYAMTLGKEANSLATAMMSDNAKFIWAKAKQHAYALPLEHQLKYCPHCVEEDLVVHKRFVWRNTHQLYGVMWCEQHKLPLQSMQCGEGGINRRYVYPKTSTMTNEHELSQRSRYLSRYIEQLFQYLCINPIPQSMTEYYHGHLHEAGYLTPKHRIRMRCLKRDLFAFWKPLFTDFNMSLPLELARFSHVSKMISPSHPTHYLKHVLLMAYLSETPGSFFSKCKMPTHPEEHGSHSRVQVDENEVTGLLKVGHSLRSISEQTGYAVATIKMIALRNNFPINRRRKILDDDKERDIWRKAFMGIHRGKIAEIHNISVGAVEQIIQSHKGLSEWRHHLMMMRRKRHHRGQLLSFRNATPQASRSDIKKALPSYMWLYKNDKAWLYEHLPAPQPAKYHPALDWAARDRILAIKMRCMIKAAPSLSAIDRQLGGHGWLTKYADKLPQTSAAAREKIRQYLTDS